MRAFFFMAATSFCLANNNGPENDFTSMQKAVNLDTNLRRALLKALTELENEENLKLKNERNNMIFEKAPASSLTFTANSISTEKSTPSTLENTEKPIIVVQRSRGVQSRPITSFETTKLNPVRDAEKILASASSSFTSSEKPHNKLQNQARHFKSSSNVNSLVNYVRITSAPNTPVLIRTTPATTTTTPTPTTSTEESEAKVEDVQFFTAPLVAAFTVHQDERGLPKSVIPLYRPSDVVAKKQAESLKQDLFSRHEILKQQQFVMQQDVLRRQALERQQELEKQQEIFKQKTLLLKQQEQHKKQELLKRQQELQRQQNLIKQNEEELKQRQLQQEQLRYSLTLQDKQRRLEEEIRLLRQKQEQQEYLLRQQQFSQANQLRDEKQFQMQNNQQTLVPVVTPIAVPLIKAPTVTNDFSGASKNRGTIISLQPSIAFDPAALPNNAQILPIKNAVDFRQSFIPTTTLIPLVPVSQQLSPHLPQTLPQPIPQPLPQDLPQYLTHQQPPSIQSIPHFNFVQTIQPQSSLASPQGNRIFRQDTGTGNFFNHQPTNSPTQNSFNHFVHPSFQSTRFFRSNTEGTQTVPGSFQRAQSPIINNHLNSLLYNTGVYNGRQYEDLNIVSKVLSLNHLGNNQRFETSSDSERRLPSAH